MNFQKIKSLINPFSFYYSNLMALKVDQLHLKIPNDFAIFV